MSAPTVQPRLPRFFARRIPLAGRCLALGLALLVAAGCGMMDSAIATGRAPKPTIRVGSANFAEQVILGELYSQALEAGGYRVERALSLGPRETVEPALESGRIDLYPEYLATLLTFVSGDPNRASSDPATTHRNLRAALEPLGIAVLDYAPAANTNGFVVTRATARKHDLDTLSDLAPVAPQLVLGGPPECPVRFFCLPGLRQTYGLNFRAFRIYDAGGPLTVAALESGQIDVGLMFTTDPQINARDFVLLADDRNLQLADNVAPVIRADTLKKAPSDLPTILNDLSAKLTTPELTRLNAQVSLENQQPRTAATNWLKAHGLTK